MLAAAVCSCTPKKSGPPGPTPSPTATPTPVPTPVSIPYKRLETSKLFNGLQVHSSIDAELGENAATERQNPESYTLDLQLKVRVPPPKFDLSQLSAINPQLPAMLPGLEPMLKQAKVSHFFKDFYGLKVASLQRNLARLDALLSRHNFFDCETILELQHPDSKRRALLIQSDMDIDMDGSDPERVPDVDGSVANFQPMTSYRWPKKTALANSFLGAREAKLKQLESEISGKTISLERNREVRELIGPLRYEVNQLKTMSFLVSTTDPFVVLPGSIVGKNQDPFTPHLGDYCVVIFEDRLYPAIVGDVGPSTKIGEASLRLGKAINPKANAYNRSTNDLKISYLVFPNSADKPWSAPDLKRWHQRCDQLLKELGGYQGQLQEWEDLIKPLPTPTPTPTSSPLAAPSASPSPSIHPPVPPGNSTPIPVVLSGSASISGSGH